MSPDNASPQVSGGPVAEAESLLIRQRDSFLAQARQIDQIISNLRSMGSVPKAAAIDAIPPITTGQYKGMKLSPAFEAYLKERKGFRIPIERVVADLQLAGADMGGPKRPAQQNLKITMQMRKSLVQWEPETWTMWLAPTAEEAPRKRAPRKKH
jgi:hypothetical protein